MEPVILSLAEEPQAAVAVSLGRNHHRCGTVARTKIAFSAGNVTVDVVLVMVALVETVGNSSVALVHFAGKVHLTHGTCSSRT